MTEGIAMAERGTFYARAVPEAVARPVRAYCAGSGITLSEYVDRTWRLYRAVYREKRHDLLADVGLGPDAVEGEDGAAGPFTVLQARDVPIKSRQEISNFAERRKISLADWVARTWELRRRLLSGGEDALLDRVGLSRLDIA